MNHLAKTTRFHTVYRQARQRGLSRIAALEASKKSDWNAYVEMCKLQEDGQVLQSLDAPDLPRVMAVLNSGGRLA
jgi:hypothetical protein